LNVPGKNDMKASLPPNNTVKYGKNIDKYLIKMVNFSSTRKGKSNRCTFSLTRLTGRAGLKISGVKAYPELG
jgi:hypothetical protein